ncbi:MAG: SEC-C domain-containing protein [Firmicutes bacterium]|nr:SEC-C domain-containing protein [Bacillota bacterium]MBQ3520902.1 SEC-C domain-containing protein [Bacillota bacterium]MBQ3612444.1 SEC-C domain-containing protein [Bacillota bacterium]MBQ4596652.1 SEC-C domain-containing protein [Bacillota bacterium]MBR1993842.1 SEC-C domain-containing protein [Bacillota bacterium]
MTLYEQWKELIENQTEETFEEFWEEYAGAETKLYSAILDDPAKKIEGTLGELAAENEIRPVIYMGFLDGIDTSLKKSQDFQSFDENSKVEIEIEPETLFYNMLAAGADYLYGLPQWEDILGLDKMKEIAKKYKQSKTVVKEKKIGRNEPCPCGSGKKYKHCCGRN